MLETVTLEQGDLMANVVEKELRLGSKENAQLELLNTKVLQTMFNINELQS